MIQDIKYAASLSGVKEVSILGLADLNYWNDMLNPYAIKPLSVDNKAQIQIISAEAKFKGINFSEVSFSVVIEPPPISHKLEDAACLIQAYNSNKLFAFSE